MRTVSLFLMISSICLVACSQNKKNTAVINNSSPKDIAVGGICEGCEAIYESPVPFNELDAIDTLPDFSEPGPKIEISGTIFKSDGITPAPGIVMYLYHTDQEGLYSKGTSETIWSKRHGYIRGWLKTDDSGYFKFYTLIPASYPNTNFVKHIHPTIKEPGKKEYWIDDFIFYDDPYLTEKERTKKNAVGGNGVLTPVYQNGLLRATRNIILGLHVADYPKH